MAEMALNAMSDINSYISLARDPKVANLVNPEVFYSKQLLDTIRLDASHYVYFRLADEVPIQEKADKLVLRRWAPLQAHTVPLAEGIPPKSDKGSVQKYELQAHQYGRYMEFSDKVDFAIVDPVLAHYTKEYALVAMETLDLLAREQLMVYAQPFYAGGAKNFEELTVDSKPNMTDLRLIVLSMKRALVKPRSNQRFHVIGSPEFYYDLISDETVEKYMRFNNTTSTMYSNSKLCPMFDMEFYETLCGPTSGEYYKTGEDGVSTELVRRVYSVTDGEYTYNYQAAGDRHEALSPYVKDSLTGQDASYIPNRMEWGALSPATYEFKAQHIFVVGKDALTRTGLSGEGNAKMYVKEAGSTGVLDPINQRQSIGFKINSVGFGSTRPEAIVDYICVPSQCLTV